MSLPRCRVNIVAQEPSDKKNTDPLAAVWIDAQKAYLYLQAGYSKSEGTQLKLSVFT